MRLRPLPERDWMGLLADALEGRVRRSPASPRPARTEASSHRPMRGGVPRGAAGTVTRILTPAALGGPVRGALEQAVGLEG